MALELTQLISDFKSVGEAIDDTLTRLDEFSGLVDVISCHVSPETTVDILSKKEELFALFQRVRKLEFAVAQVRQTVDAFDHLVAAAETELNSTTEGKIKNFLKPFFKKKSSVPSTPTDTVPPIFSSPPIFSTKDMFATSPPDS
ncbi:hypothetical protein GE061_005781 [Apolygus lucorum]|uniref:Uncharacterized protein n=1 Tax=Apolygus lucorum TaxID=248454 RepID=A0A6A4J2C2_APOLU|nr:hypothetical protein GE061_005781 [Apolygus lucorum]